MAPQLARVPAGALRLLGQVSRTQTQFFIVQHNDEERVHENSIYSQLENHHGLTDFHENPKSPFDTDIRGSPN